jgi:hypothetical protein
LKPKRVWKHVTKAIEERDEINAIKHKHTVEEEQRNLTKEREKKKIQWQPKHFENIGKTWIYKNLQ